MSECCGNGCGCHPEGNPKPQEVAGKIKLEYLQHTTETVATLNDKKEYELKPTKYLNRGDLVWVIQPDDSFIKYEII
jgi:hypothetical protein